MIIADTSALLALWFDNDKAHASVKKAYENINDTLTISTFVIAELDYLVSKKYGIKAELEVLSELAGGAYDLPHLSPNDITDCSQIIQKYSDQNIGITDASLVVLAQRYKTADVLTLDHRHFTTMKTTNGKPFNILNETYS